ncbi:MAG: hypothetical protein ABSB41_03950 [Anaerolineales bacterium]
MGSEGNTNALKHGGAAGAKALTSGAPLSGPAARAEVEVRQDYRDLGAAGVIKAQAIRLEAVSRLYYDAFIAAIQKNMLQEANAYAARFGWLANSSIRAWDTVRKAENGKGGRLGDVLDAYHKDTDEKPG